MKEMFACVYVNVCAIVRVCEYAEVYVCVCARSRVCVRVCVQTCLYTLNAVVFKTNCGD